MTTFILTITLLNDKFNTEYMTIEGVYANKETAKTVATKKAKQQKQFWHDSYFVKLSKAKVALVNRCDGFSKVYEIKEMEVK